MECCRVIEELENIEIEPENVLNNFAYETNLPSFADCDINSDKYKYQ